MQRPYDGSDNKLSALFMTPEAPYPTVGGGALRSASLLEYLGRRYAIDVIVFREPGAPDPSRFIPAPLVRQVHVVGLPYHSRRLLARAGRNFWRLVRGSPPLNDRFGGFGELVSAFLSGRRYELAVLEHFWCAEYWEQVAPRAQRVILDLHNIESVLLAGYANVESWPISYALSRFHTACLELERCWLPRFNLLLAPSDQDAERIQGIAPESQVHVYPNAIPSVTEPVREQEDVIVFSGNLEYHPNLIAVRFFLEQIWPLLRERWPGLVWRLVGRNPAAVKKYVHGDPRIEVAGPPENAIDALAASKVAVVPLLAGSGTRVKILEAWAAGRAVVSTCLGAEGLPGRHGEHLLLADEPGAFAEAVSTLLESPALRRRLGQAGRRLYEREFTWESAWRRLEEAGI
jgi:glycosyltransferase involved in cell wall biosynthesis